MARRKDAWKPEEYAVIEAYAERVIAGMSYYRAVKEIFPALIPGRTTHAIQTQVRLAVLRKQPGFTTLNRAWNVGNRGQQGLGATE